MTGPPPSRSMAVASPHRTCPWWFPGTGFRRKAGLLDGRTGRSRSGRCARPGWRTQCLAPAIDMRSACQGGVTVAYPTCDDEMSPWGRGPPWMDTGDRPPARTRTDQLAVRVRMLVSGRMPHACHHDANRTGPVSQALEDRSDTISNASLAVRCRRAVGGRVSGPPVLPAWSRSGCSHRGPSSRVEVPHLATRMRPTMVCAEPTGIAGSHRRRYVGKKVLSRG